MLNSLDSTIPTSSELPHLILFKDPDPRYTSLLSPYLSKLEYLPLLEPAALPFSPIPLPTPSCPDSTSASTTTTTTTTSSSSSSSCSLAFIFTSKHAVSYFLPFLSFLTSSTKYTFIFFAVGNATAQRLRQAGYEVLGTHTGCADALAEFIYAWSLVHLQVAQYWFIAGKDSLDKLPQVLLHEKRLPLSILRVYQMVPKPISSEPNLTTQQVWVLFSPRGVQLLHTHLSSSSSSSPSCCSWPRKVIAIGPSTAQALKTLGVVPITCTEPTPEAILTILKQWTLHPSET